MERWTNTVQVLVVQMKTGTHQVLQIPEHTGLFLPYIFQ